MCSWIHLCFVLVEKKSPLQASWAGMTHWKYILLREGQSNHNPSSFAMRGSGRNQLLFSTRFWFLLNIVERALEKADDNLQGCLERRGLLTKARIKISSTPIKRSKLIFCNMNVRAIQLQHFLFSWFLSFWDRWCNCKWKYRSMEFCFLFSWGKNNICQCFPDKRPKYALLKPQVRVMSVSQLAPSITPAKNASSNRWS